MIAFVVAVADCARYEAIAEPALARVAEIDSVVIAEPTGGPPQPVLNRILDGLADVPDLEAAVIVHEDVRLLDPDTAGVVRRAFADPDVAIAGVIGRSGAHGLAWWEAGTAAGRVLTPHHPHGEVVGTLASGDVDVVDGIVLCLNPWAVRTLRFDERLAPDFHGYDVDLCYQARHHGRRVVVVDLAASHDHRPLFEDAERWMRNELRFRQRWTDHRLISQRRHRALANGGHG